MPLDRAPARSGKGASGQAGPSGRHLRHDRSLSPSRTRPGPRTRDRADPPLRCGQRLVVLHINAEALRLTLETGAAHYYSRSRQSLWKKGETSGQIQQVLEVRVDCDQDAVLLKVRPQGDGGACHVGFRSCFYRVVENGSLVERP